jgi:translation elongation factor P/translation initiation factor 5A
MKHLLTTIIILIISSGVVYGQSKVLFTSFNSAKEGNYNDKTWKDQTEVDIKALFNVGENNDVKLFIKNDEIYFIRLTSYQEIDLDEKGIANVADFLDEDGKEVSILIYQDLKSMVILWDEGLSLSLFNS